MFEFLNIPAADPVTLPFTGGPGPVIFILSSYSIFIWLGPKFMAHREPFQLRGVLKVYNLMQILFNSAILIGVRNIIFIYIYKYYCYLIASSSGISLRKECTT